MKKLIITLILVISLVGCKSKINLPKVDTNLPLNLILPEREYEDQGELIKERQVIESITINELTLEDSEYYKKMYSELRNLNLRDNFKLLTLDFGEVINFNWQPELIEKFNITKYEDWNTIVKNISVYDDFESLWKDNYRNEFLDDFELLGIEEITSNNIFKDNDLLQKLSDSDLAVKNKIQQAIQYRESIKEVDLDNDGVPDRIDPDDNRNEITKESDYDKIDKRRSDRSEPSL